MNSTEIIQHAKKLTENDIRYIDNGVRVENGKRTYQESVEYSMSFPLLEKIIKATSASHITESS